MERPHKNLKWLAYKNQAIFCNRMQLFFETEYVKETEGRE